MKVLMMDQHSLVILNNCFCIWIHGRHLIVFWSWIIVPFIMWIMYCLFVKHGKHSCCLLFSLFPNLVNSSIRVYYLPPYSPDLNPIEEAFSYVKSVLQQNGTAFRNALESKNAYSVHFELHCALAMITSEKAQAWMGHSGYLCVVAWICIFFSYYVQEHLIIYRFLKCQSAS